MPRINHYELKKKSLQCFLFWDLFSAKIQRQLVTGVKRIDSRILLNPLAWRFCFHIVVLCLVDIALNTHNDSSGIQPESMLTSQIYHLVRVFNLLSPFVLNIKNHLIESPKSIFLHFSLAYCYPFWFIAYNDSLVPSISKSVFCRVDYVSKNSSFYPPVIEKKKPSLCSRASLSSPCMSAQLHSTGMLTVHYHCPGWAAFLPKLSVEGPQNTGCQDNCVEGCIRVH